MKAALVVLLAALVVLCGWYYWKARHEGLPSRRTQTISAVTDNTGTHQGTAAVAGPASITCTSAVSDIPNPQPVPSCNITAPGFSGPLNPPNGTAGSSGAGTVTLTCNGQGNQITCSARIVE